MHNAMYIHGRLLNTITLAQSQNLTLYRHIRQDRKGCFSSKQSGS